MKIWIDDIRPAPKGYVHCYSFEDFISAIKVVSHIEIIDFDHDLGEDTPSGYDIAKFLVENHIPVEHFRVHSQNVVGKQNIVDLLTHYGYHYQTDFSL